MVDDLNRTLVDKNIEIRAGKDVFAWLVKSTCTDRSYGARPLRRAIQKYIEDAISESLIKGKFHERETIEVFLDDNKLAFRSALKTAL
jgi:ATP-dependent Clp protease ATP-binding subunit ClpC